MNSIIIDKKDEFVKYEKEKLITSKHKIPTRLIDILILTDYVSITPKDILKITSKNIPIIYISNDNKNISLTLPGISKNSEFKLMQYKAVDKKVTIAKRLIKDKIATHQKSLQQFDIEIDIQDELNKLDEVNEIDSILGIEGNFAKRYFGYYFALFPKNLTKGYRSKNPPLDPINAILSFIYTLSYNAITAKLYMRGFEPSISYLHTPFRNHFALSSDLLEPLRADINNFVAKLFLENRLVISDFTNKNGVYLKYKPRTELWKELKPFMANINKQVNKEIIKLKKEIESLS